MSLLIAIVIAYRMELAKLHVEMSALDSYVVREGMQQNPDQHSITLLVVLPDPSPTLYESNILHITHYIHVGTQHRPHPPPPDNVTGCSKDFDSTPSLPTALPLGSNRQW